MTKFIYRLFSLALVTILGFSITFNVAASSQMTTAVYFETCDVPEDVIECFANNIDGLAKSVAITYNVNADKIAFGGFYPIRGTENMYYIPVYFESECLCLVTYRLQDDIVSLNYSSAASDCLNNLPNGVYYFENVNNCNFIVGAEAVFEIETMYSLEENDVEWPTYNPEDNDSVMNIRGGLQYIGIGRQTRDVSTNSLDVPLYANGGNPGYGYCWLSCCC